MMPQLSVAESLEAQLACALGEGGMAWSTRSSLSVTVTLAHERLCAHTCRSGWMSVSSKCVTPLKLNWGENGEGEF